MGTSCSDHEKPICRMEDWVIRKFETEGEGWDRYWEGECRVDLPLDLQSR